MPPEEVILTFGSEKNDEYVGAYGLKNVHGSESLVLLDTVHSQEKEI